MSIQKQINYKVVTLNGKKLELTNSLKLNINENVGNYLIHRSILRHHVLNKQGTVSTKTRSEVQGGGRKPWKQKGTGRARAGSNRSPLWKGGGVIFGPKPHNLTYKLNKKERKLALHSLLYNKRNKILFIDDLEEKFNVPKTKEFCQILKDCKLNQNQKILIIVSVKTKSLKLAVQNLKNIEIISASNLNTLSLIKAKQIIMTSKAVSVFKEVFYV